MSLTLTLTLKASTTNQDRGRAGVKGQKGKNRARAKPSITAAPAGMLTGAAAKDGQHGAWLNAFAFTPRARAFVPFDLAGAAGHLLARVCAPGSGQRRGQWPPRYGRWSAARALRGLADVETVRTAPAPARRVSPGMADDVLLAAWSGQRLARQQICPHLMKVSRPVRLTARPSELKLLRRVAERPSF